MPGKGPPKTPSSILAARGSWRAASRLKGEPKPEIAVPEVPAWVNKDVRGLFKTLASDLAEIGVMTKVDPVALGMLVNSFDVYNKARRLVNSQGAVTTTPTGYDQMSPAFQVMARAQEQLLKWCREFGLTPAGRAGVSVGSRKPDVKSEEAKPNILKVV